MPITADLACAERFPQVDQLAASFAALSGALAGLKELFWQCGVCSCGELAGFAYCAWQRVEARCLSE